ncbi:MAG: histone deacetylase [Candidatus Obscuribacterales bacterium]|nr:histone deacetylase [Candidatus Obscuribacterales bacterium]
MEKLLVHAPAYDTDLSQFGIDKPLALDRGTRVLEQLAIDLGQPVETLIPSKIPIVDILLVHNKDYFDSLRLEQTWLSIFDFKEGEYFPEKAVNPLPAILGDIRLKCGGTKLAAETALSHGLSANLGGGYHHAFPGEGRGFCSLNDIAIAIRCLQRDKKIETALVVDLDFHQGDGTALIFEKDPSVFTLSVHSKEGWPEQKQTSDMDVEIKESETHLYLEKTEAAIKQVLQTQNPDLIIFVAGSDPYEKDVLPGSRFIKLSLQTMQERDRFVIETFHRAGLPLAMVFAGGYGPDVWEVHYHAVKSLLACKGLVSV